MHADAVVIGGGSSGSSIAFNLARRGLRQVVLIDKAGLAAGATGSSSANVRTHYTVEALARMARFSLGVFCDFDERIGGDCGFQRTGFLVLAAAGDAGPLRRTVDMNRRVGIASQVLDRDQVHDLEPRILLDDVAVAAWEPDSGHADPHGTTVCFAEAARRLGAELKIGVEVEAIQTVQSSVRSVRTSAGTIDTDTVVVAAGYRSRDLLLPLGIELPLVPVRHVMGIVHRAAGFGSRHPVISDRILGNYYVPEGQELTLVGSNPAMEGTVDEDVEADRQADEDSLERLADRFFRRFTGQGEATLRGGFTGIYDCSPDLQPFLGPVPGIRGLHLAAGFSGHGFKLCPAVGEIVSDGVITGRSSLVDIGLFSPERFAVNRPIRPDFSYSLPIDGMPDSHNKGSDASARAVPS
jgi:sarcosine oxidase, subunit beta